MSPETKRVPAPACPKCEKRLELCLCDRISPKKNRIGVLFFQHPQEPDKDLGSARIANLALENSILKIALSVPNLKKALGREEAPPSEWGVLYLGSGFKNNDDSRGLAMKPGLYPVKKDGSLLPPAEAKAVLAGLKGIILLDGTWSQAKTLWWRNSWLLKCKRLVLVPKSESMYRDLRREPRSECLSTIETTADALEALGEAPAVANHLREVFGELLGKYRGLRKSRRRDPGHEATHDTPEETTEETTED